MIVSCGEALVDMVPEAVPGGGPMNVAVAAARLGGPSAFVGRISRDAHGELIRRHLEANGVDLRACEALSFRLVGRIRERFACDDEGK